MPSPIVPALLIIDFQEDFCPPTGSLAVSDGRTIAPLINHLLTLPFALKVATKDWHPADHISFAANHAAPNNVPFESMVDILNPLGGEEKQTTRLWPVHCVQNTHGAKLVPELNVDKVDVIVEKGQDKRVEMYSAFTAPFYEPMVAKSELASILKAKGITHVYVVGLAADYCVKFSALDAKREGFETFVVGDATKPVDAATLETAKNELAEAGVEWIQSDSKEIDWVKALGE
jgi:nicotinamidase-related amidase